MMRNPRTLDADPTLIQLEKHVADYLTANDNAGYNRFTDFDWSALKEGVHRSSLTDVHVGAVETAMLVEDHIPGYASEYIRYFALDEDRTDEEADKPLAGLLPVSRGK